jgi:uncharacterized protein YceH (UPF0502 family)
LLSLGRATALFYKKVVEGKKCLTLADADRPGDLDSLVSSVVSSPVSSKIDLRMQILNAIEARVLGSLIEKDITTPDYYPLSLNALVNACNQKNNRDPVMTLDENAVRNALTTLQEKRMAGPASGADSRVTKYEHRLQEVFNFDRREIAIICVLLLRGAQTPGELRGRADRMYHFDALEDVVSTLDHRARRNIATCICSRASHWSPRFRARHSSESRPLPPHQRPRYKQRRLPPNG